MNLALDLTTLHIFRTVAETGSLTGAARRVGVTQSALTRQIQTLEARLGAKLFERTTRRLRLTEAGAFLLAETAGLGAQVDATLRTFRERFTDAAREIRIGLSRSVALAHLPGLIHAHVRRAPHVRTHVSHLDRTRLLACVEDGTLDLAVLCAPEKLPAGCQISHEMSDAFAFIAPAAAPVPAGGAPLRGWLQRQPWLLLGEQIHTGAVTRDWLRGQGCLGPSVMELDGFDLIVHLVALGLGVGFVPQRALAGFPRKRQIARVPWPVSFERRLVVVTRRTKTPLPAHVSDFIASILFS